MVDVAADSLTTGTGIYVHSKSDSNVSHDLVLIENSSPFRLQHSFYLLFSMQVLSKMIRIHGQLHCQ